MTKSNSFRLLLATQFLTVFNDNAFKQVVLLMAIGASELGGDPQARAGFVFAIPFLLLLVFAGDVADRISKRHVLVWTKWAETAVMALASYALWHHDLKLGLVALFFMGAQSAFLGPAKYGIVPELVPDEKLSKANGILQASVMMGILFGTGLAGVFKAGLGEDLWMAGAFFTLVAFIGSLIAQRIELVPAADPGRRLHFNPFRRFGSGLKLALNKPSLLPAIIGHGLFWLVGGLGLFAWNEIGLKNLNVNEAWWTGGLASLSLSIGIGSMVAGHFCKEKPRTKFTTIGATMMSIGYLAIALGPQNPWFVWAFSLLSNFFMGFYLVPLKSFIQRSPEQSQIGRIQGTSQMVDWIFIVGASLVKEVLTQFEINGTQTFFAMSGTMLIAALASRQLTKSTVLSL